MMETMDHWNFGPQSRLVVLTGAGISAESGIRTFRDAGGLWEGHDVMDVATPEGFAKDPNLVIQFYNQRRRQLFEVEPNPAHEALADLSRRLGPERFYLVTQNVDDLHERAGTPQVLHMHGELRKLRCLGSQEHVHPWTEDQSNDDRCSICGAGLRPHVVWFGEMPLFMDEIHQRISQCTHFLYIGTSSQVYPAAGFKGLAKGFGAKVMCVNLETDAHDPDTDIVIEGKAGERLPPLLSSWH